MRTIHIKNYVPLLEGNAVYTSDIPKLKNLIKELYDYTLKDDSIFHFFFEPEIIIRIESEQSLEKVKSFLQERSISFEEYEYPFPPEGKFGEGKDSVVAKHLDLFLPLFHASSVAAITLDEAEHAHYLERLVHTAFNPKFYPHEHEGQYLLKLAELKLGKQKIKSIVESDST